MKIDKIIIANLKCSGCATTIQNELSKINGVNKVTVDIKTDSIDVEHNDVSLDTLKERLYQLGYPEATEENGLLLQIKSYASCMIGKVNNL
ncbi:MAG: heavy-metal-associated domain-containing protein [Cytophagales bacterium]|nr:MAG: heavy-metal-associated domain-containing protein [Cytophagales bacterium]